MGCPRTSTAAIFALSAHQHSSSSGTRYGSDRIATSAAVAATPINCRSRTCAASQWFRLSCTTCTLPAGRRTENFRARGCFCQRGT
uniref:Putative secreted protein n=1 Tax=Anopheles darlingi TaxID=43151 RepID=A0A2M4D3U3_ANODA